jgi:hypothetical protein
MEPDKWFKFLIICISFLMISNVLVTATSINQKNLNKAISLVDPVDVPEWSIGDFWIYDMHFYFTLAGVFGVNGNDPNDPEKGITNMRVEVVGIDETNDEYTLEITGGKLIAQLEIFGVGLFGSYTADVEGVAHIEISTLAIKDFEFTSKGKYKLVVERQTDVTFNMVFDPTFDFFDFPMDPDEEPWNADTYATLSGHIFIDGLYDDDFSTEGPFENETISFINQEKITVPAGTFDCFQISGSLGPSHSGWSKLWYSPDAKYLVKVDEKIEDWAGVDAQLDLTLQATNSNINAVLEVMMHRIKAIDPIEGWPGDEADWSYRISVDDGDRWIDDVNDNYCDNDDDHIEDVSHFFNLNTLTPRIKIKFWERDDIWPDGPDLADISSQKGGGIDNEIPDWDWTMFKCKYNILDNKFEYNDTLELDDIYFVSSGEFPPDGSTNVDENDAKAWFIISDDYEPPKKPNKPTGPIVGKPGQDYTYSTSPSDPDENQRFYKWDWGDGTFSDWFGPYNADETIEATHAWAKEDIYEIRVKAKDVYDVESQWSEPLSVSMPRIKASFQFFENILDQFPILEKILLMIFD